MPGLIKNIEDIGGSIYADYNYLLRYDKRKKAFICSCDAFTHERQCHHIKEFKEKLKL